MKGTNMKYKDWCLASTILSFVCRIYGRRQGGKQGDLSGGFASGLIWQWQWGHTLYGCRQIDEMHKRKHVWIRLLAQHAYADDTILMAGSEEELKSLLMRVKESENAGLKLNIIKLRLWHPAHHFMANKGGKVEAERDFIFLGSKITVDSDHSHEIKRHLLLGRKAMTNLDSVLKIRDTTLLTKVYIVKAMVSPVVMYGCESWTIKKAEHWRTDVSNCGAGEDSWESPGLQGNQTSRS